MLSATYSYHVGRTKEKGGKNEENGTENERLESTLSFRALL